MNTLRMIDNFPLPARIGNASPLQLDLSNFYNVSPDSVRNILDSDLPVAAGLPLAPLR